MSRATRLFFKPALRHISNLQVLRRYLDFLTKINRINPRGVRYENSQLGDVPVLWADRPDVDDNKVLLYIHGGGFVFGSADTHKHLAADIGGQLGIRAVLPNYRLIPEHPYPASFDDVLSCYHALLAQGFKGRDIVLGGDSAGGNLVLALLHHIGVAKLDRPNCSFTFAALTDLNGMSPTVKAHAQSDCVLVAEKFNTLARIYAPDRDASDPYLSPQNGVFTGMTPILMQASKKEMLRDDSRAMVKVLISQGVDAQLSEFDNGFHVFQMLRGIVPEADKAIAQVVAFVNIQLGAR